MSTFNDIDITCVQCGTDFRGTIWTAVNAHQDPELKDILLGGELNMVMCPECTHISYQDHFVLYQDLAAEIVAYVYPPSEEPKAEQLAIAITDGFNQAQEVFPEKERKKYDPILLFGLKSLVELMQEEDERGEQSQIAEAICREKQIPFTLLSPAHARRHALMRTLPGTSAKIPNRSELLAGLATLLGVNPALDRYEKLRQTVLAKEQWVIKK